MAKYEKIIYNIVKEAVSPPGWSGTVEKMKEHKDIDNPFALAWWMHGEGYKPHHKEKKKRKKKSSKDFDYKENDAFKKLSINEKNEINKLVKKIPLKDEIDLTRLIRKLKKSKDYEKEPKIKYIRSQKDKKGNWHIGKKKESKYGRSGLLANVYYVTSCTGKQLGGPWGQSEITKMPSKDEICPRCLKIKR